MYDDSWQEVPHKLSIRDMSGGYSRIGSKWAHRLAWEETYGPIPDEMEVCHKCPIRNCIEPLHLFLGTHWDNMQDAVKKGEMKGKSAKAFQTHCIHGHEFTVANTYIRPNGTRACKECHANRERKAHQQRKEQWY